MRDFSYNGIRALITLVLAIIFATLFKGRGKATEQYTDVLNISGAMYAASVFSSVLYLFMVGGLGPGRKGPGRGSARMVLLVPLFFFWFCALSLGASCTRWHAGVPCTCQHTREPSLPASQPA